MVIIDHDTGDEDEVTHRLRRWDEIRARSEQSVKTSAGSIRISCWDCYFSYLNLDTACPRHETPEERAEALRVLQASSYADGAFFAFLKKLPQMKPADGRYVLPEGKR